MTYRNELHSLHARIAELERELDQVRPATDCNCNAVGAFLALAFFSLTASVIVVLCTL
jgi:hypothetical protein